MGDDSVFAVVFPRHAYCASLAFTSTGTGFIRTSIF